ncbi:MAG: amidophosphoribosyltransferase [bacterium]|nr:amidophosphoribosyltransferase [bacterium]
MSSILSLPELHSASYRPSVNEKCGVFGIYNKPGVARDVFYGIFALQHRGQDSAGIAVADGNEILVHKGQGLVTTVFHEDAIIDALCEGHIGVGHTRYATSGGSTIQHAQPVDRFDGIVVVHNGNLPVTDLLQTFLSDKKINIDGCNDTELMTAALWYYMHKQGRSLPDAITEAFPLFTGVFSLLVMTKDSIAAVRDQCGIRPLSLASFGEGYAFASETCAFDLIGAKFIRDVVAGELVWVDSHGLHRRQIVTPDQRLDIFEFVYFSRPDSILMGQRVNEVRRRMGKQLASENAVDADIVVPIPDSSIPAAEGFAEYSHIPYCNGLIKNRYIARTFIQPSEEVRKQTSKMKLVPLPEQLRGKNIVLVDDSIVRGTTIKYIARTLREAGVLKIHLVISSPPDIYPDFYGIDTPDQNKLIAFGRTNDQIKHVLGVDELSYISLGGMIAATGVHAGQLCTACFTGEYPIDIGNRQSEIVHVKNVVKPASRAKVISYPQGIY